MSEMKMNSTVNLSKGGDLFYKVFQTTLKIPTVEVNRESFLRESFGNSSYNMEEILKSGPRKAGVSLAKIKKLAQGVAKWHTAKAAALSFGAGLPGGWWLTATIPADLAQFYANCLQGAQKIAFLYGYNFNQCADEQKHMLLMTFLIIMLGQGGGDVAKQIIAKSMTKVFKDKVQQETLRKLINEVARRLGYEQLGKRAFREVLKKAIPVVGGVISGGVTFVSSKVAFNKVIAFFHNEAVEKLKGE